MVITMQIQTIFKAGNSNVVTIPTELMQQLNFQVGEKVVVEKSPVGEGMLIKKVAKLNTPTNLINGLKSLSKRMGRF